LPGCASSPATMTVMRNETVPVLSATPMSDPTAQESCPVAATGQPDQAVDLNGFCVVYEYQGHGYAVLLPTAPGPTLVIQVPEEIPVAPDQTTGADAPLARSGPVYPAYPLYPVYPSYPFFPMVYMGGVYYPPRHHHPHPVRPYVQPVRPPVPMARPVRPPTPPLRKH
jgi:hypothetical protein